MIDGEARFTLAVDSTQLALCERLLNDFAAFVEAWRWFHDECKRGWCATFWAWLVNQP